MTPEQLNAVLAELGTRMICGCGATLARFGNDCSADPKAPAPCPGREAIEAAIKRAVEEHCQCGVGQCCEVCNPHLTAQIESSDPAPR